MLRSWGESRGEGRGRGHREREEKRALFSPLSLPRFFLTNIYPMGCYFSSPPHSSGKPVVWIQNRSDMNSQWNCTKISFSSSIVCAWSRKTFWMNTLRSSSQIRGAIYWINLYRTTRIETTGNPSSVIKSNMAAMAWYLKKQIQLPQALQAWLPFLLYLFVP